LTRRSGTSTKDGGLAGAGDLALPPADPPGSLSIYHQLTVRTARRDALMRHLADHGIASSIHYPSPLHRQPALAGTAAAPGGVAIGGADLPVATAAAAQVLCLPMFPELTDEEVAAVCEAVRAFFASQSS